MKFFIYVLALLIAAATILLHASTCGGQTSRPDAATAAAVRTNAETVTYSAEKIAELRGRAAELAMVPEGTPEGWSKSRVDPVKLMPIFTELRLREGFTLRAYQYKSGGGGNGVVWAMPVEAEFPLPKDCPRLENHLFKAPKPFDALDDAMDAIEGRDTAQAYLEASLLRRELKEFGAIWHGTSWGTHFVLDTSPLNKVAGNDGDPMRTPRTKANEWKWLERRPTDWTPRVTLEADRAIVTFCTFSGHDTETIYRHVDIYRRGKFRPRTEETKVAEGKGGYLF